MMLGSKSKQNYIEGFNGIAINWGSVTIKLVSFYHRSIKNNEKMGR
ncbi:hypothetical protein rsdtw13_34530 [Clostridium sp. TW13]|uniref:Uncharacterized protein n=1 Tax=Inconstantimicrobium mannanitabidum TaxID=1604901 RepID=A0ACB5RGI7_9CLOT|nr:hypothetical protein rsdtw13_34530 [Clostridium sp. TW13]